MRILLVEDNRRFNASLKAGLEEDGYAVDATFDGDEGESFALAAPYDLIILDVMLPKKDGYSLCRDLRQQRVASPILMLTARDTVDDRVQGLDSGADDYLVKPFSMNELRARLRALLRRNTTEKIAVLQSGDLVLDPANHHVERGGLPIDLTPREFAILEYLLRHSNQILTREMIEAHVWDFDFTSGSNVVDVYIRRLRRKIDDPHPMKLLETVRGVGYRLLRFPDTESAGRT
jgi:DNA-binding response OmpR family regulator